MLAEATVPAARRGSRHRAPTGRPMAARSRISRGCWGSRRWLTSALLGCRARARRRELAYREVTGRSCRQAGKSTACCCCCSGGACAGRARSCGMPHRRDGRACASSADTGGRSRAFAARGGRHSSAGSPGMRRSSSRTARAWSCSRQARRPATVRPSIAAVLDEAWAHAGPSARAGVSARDGHSRECAAESSTSTAGSDGRSPFLWAKVRGAAAAEAELT